MPVMNWEYFVGKEEGGCSSVREETWLHSSQYIERCIVNK